MRYHLRQALLAARISLLDEVALLAGALLTVTGVVVAVAAGAPGGPARTLGTGGLAVLVACAAWRGVRLYRAGVAASLPTSVARVAVRVRPRRTFGVVAVGLALGLPLVAAVGVLSVLAWGWLVLAFVLLLGCAGLLVTRLREQPSVYDSYTRSSAVAEELLQRLCMRAGMRLPPLVVDAGGPATAWTERGRIHVTEALVDLLDRGELEAVLAHELAHLAHRDAAVMEACAAPSRVLLTFVTCVTRWARNGIRHVASGMPFGGWFLTGSLLAAALLGPPAYVIGWVSRLSVLGTSRAREHAADAAAATLTGRPSALASALLKLERRRARTPSVDLRQVEPHAVLCIVGGTRSRLGRLFATHPPTAARVRRLEDLERRLQGRAHVAAP